MWVICKILECGLYVRSWNVGYMSRCGLYGMWVMCKILECGLYVRYIRLECGLYVRCVLYVRMWAICHILDLG